MSTAAVGHVCFDSAVFFPLKESEKNLNDLAHEGRNGILMINPELVSTHLYTHTHAQLMTNIQPVPTNRKEHNI